VAADVPIRLNKQFYLHRPRSPDPVGNEVVQLIVVTKRSGPPLRRYTPTEIREIASQSVTEGHSPRTGIARSAVAAGVRATKAARRLGSGAQLDQRRVADAVADRTFMTPPTRRMRSPDRAREGQL
jgi:hypothetical protein